MSSVMDSGEEIKMNLVGFWHAWIPSSLIFYKELKDWYLTIYTCRLTSLKFDYRLVYQIKLGNVDLGSHLSFLKFPLLDMINKKLSMFHFEFPRQMTP